MTAPYAATIFLSAFLLFLIQPLIGRYILPWFGGGPGVWTTCLLFFQALLLAGYAWAHGLVRALGPRRQALVHTALLAAAVATLPIAPDAAWKPGPDDAPTPRILALLALCLGLPYLALAATGPLLQAWFARGEPGRSPYRLYALSNAGSLLALLVYPFAIEPLATRAQQVSGWSLGFALFAPACAWCGFRAARGAGAGAGPRPAATDAGPAPGPARIALWIALPAVASVLLLAVTNQLTYDVAAVPFLWIAPLVVYLLSFILCFDRERWYPRGLFVALLPVALLAAASLVRSADRLGVPAQIAAWCGVLFTACMACHGELYRLRPAAQRLTGYYLCVAAGGALGGLFVAVIAPLVFDRYAELPLGLAATACLLAAALAVERRNRPLARAAGAGLALAAGALYAGVALRELAASTRDALATSRNFYGVLAVREIGADPELRFRELRHGRIAHGIQFVAEARRGLATAYFGEPSGVGLALRLLPRGSERRIGVVGLGAGTLATYGRRGDRIRFYEIDPAVVDFARRYFTFLADSQASVEIALGDARLSLEREPPQAFDVLVLDAFTGDSIPVHLLTQEAFATWRRHVRDDGAIAVHVSNTHVDLRPVLWAMAERLGWRAALVRTRPDRARALGPAHWVILTADAELLARLAAATRIAEHPSDLGPLVPWSDDDVSLFALLR
jgi:spermidine synthase